MLIPHNEWQQDFHLSMGQKEEENSLKRIEKRWNKVTIKKKKKRNTHAYKFTELKKYKYRERKAR